MSKEKKNRKDEKAWINEYQKSSREEIIKEKNKQKDEN